MTLWGHLRRFERARPLPQFPESRHSLAPQHRTRRAIKVSCSRSPRRFGTKTLDFVVSRRRRYGGNVRDRGCQTYNWADAAGGERTANSAGSEGAFNRREVSEHSPVLRVEIVWCTRRPFALLDHRCPKGGPRKQASRAVSCSLAASCSRAAPLRQLSPQRLPALPTTICRRMCRHG